MPETYVLRAGTLRKLADGVSIEQYLDRAKAIGADVKICKGQPPTVATQERWLISGKAKATDGCQVECDGVCAHGHPSWMVALGII